MFLGRSMQNKASRRTRKLISTDGRYCVELRALKQTKKNKLKLKTYGEVMSGP